MKTACYFCDLLLYEKIFLTISNVLPTLYRLSLIVSQFAELVQIPGALEYAISSDDVFWMKKPPGKT